jgi:enamine deaminase RidA (YjgF/YER057c/UK114 family)
LSATELQKYFSQERSRQLKNGYNVSVRTDRNVRKNMPRKNISSGTPWEPIVGYSRAVRIDNHIWVAGTTASDAAGNVIAKGNAAEQTRYILKKIEAALRDAGASLRDVVRTRVFVINIAEWEAIGRVHGEFFGEIRPASAMVEVSKLIDPDHLVEIEVDAYLSSNGSRA